MITYYKRELKGKKMKKIKSFEKNCWINVVNPTEKEISYLTKSYDLDEPNLISGTDKNEVPRVERDNKTLYIILKILSSNKRDLETFLIIMSKDYILTLSKNQPKFIDEIINNATKFVTTKKITCLMTLLLKINNEFEKSTLQITKQVNSEKRAIVEKPTEKDLDNLLFQEEALNHFVSSYKYTNLVYERIIKQINFMEEDEEQMQDLKIEAKQGLDLCLASLKTISNLRNHLEVSLSNRLNKVITLLTIFTVVITVPAAISGLYGMNIILPLQNSPNIFFYLLGTIVIFWAMFILYLKKKEII